MLRELLYEMLHGATNFVKGIWILDSLFDLERNWFGRLLMKVLEVVGWTLWHLFMISVTGGLWLIWLGFRMIFRRMRRKHDKKQTRKNRRRA